MCTGVYEIIRKKYDGTLIPLYVVDIIKLLNGGDEDATVWKR